MIEEGRDRTVIARLPLASWRLFVATVAPGRGRPRRRRTSTSGGRGSALQACVCVTAVSISSWPWVGLVGTGDDVAVAARRAGDDRLVLVGGGARAVRRWRRVTAAWSVGQHVVIPCCWSRRSTWAPGRPGRWWWPLTWAAAPAGLPRLLPRRGPGRLRVPRPLRGELPARGRSASSRPTVAIGFAPVRPCRRPTVDVRSRYIVERSLTVGRVIGGEGDARGTSRVSKAVGAPRRAADEAARGRLGRTVGRRALGRGRAARDRRRGWPACSASPRATSSSADRGSVAVTSGRRSSTCCPRSR